MPGRPTNEPQNYYAFGFQSAKDTEATTFTHIKHLDGSGMEIEQEVQREREGGDGQEVGFVYKSKISADGQGVANARAEYAARICAAALGADVVLGAATNAASAVANIHVAIPTSSIPYLTFEQYWADEVERVSNAQITTLSIEGEAGRPIRITHNFVGGGTPYRRPVGTTLTPTRETISPAMYPQASVLLDGAANTKITKFKIDVKRGVDTDIQTNQLHREDVVALTFDVDFDVTLKFESATALYEKIQYNGGEQIINDLPTGSFKLFQAMGNSTLSRFFEINLPTFDWIDAKVNKLDPEGKTVYIDAVAAGIKGATHQIYTRTQVASIGAFFP